MTERIDKDGIPPEMPSAQLSTLEGQEPSGRDHGNNAVPESSSAPKKTAKSHSWKLLVIVLKVVALIALPTGIRILIHWAIPDYAWSTIPATDYTLPYVALALLMLAIGVSHQVQKAGSALGRRSPNWIAKIRLKTGVLLLALELWAFSFAVTAITAVVCDLGVHKLMLWKGKDFTRTHPIAIAAYGTYAIVVLYIILIFCIRHRNIRLRKSWKYKGHRKRVVYSLSVALLAINGLWTWAIISTMRESGNFSWNDPRVIALYFASGIITLCLLALIFLLKRAKTRWEVEDRLRRSEDIHDWMVFFSWTKKLIHVPTIIAGFAAAIVIQFYPESKNLVGGIWFFIWLMCYTVEESDIGLSTALVAFVTILLLAVLSVFGGVYDDIPNLVKDLKFNASSALYVGTSVVYLTAIVLSYIKGLFYYVALEPNQMIIQTKIGEDSAAFHRTEYDVRIETTVDIIEWFVYHTGTVKIQFRNGKRPPLECYVGKIGTKARYLANVLGVMAIDGTESPGAQE